MSGPTYETDFHRAASGFTAGALVGGVLVAGASVVSGLAMGMGAGVVLALLVFGVATGVWLAGLAVFGAPGWWLLHRLRFRHWAVAILFGAAVTFVVYLAMTTSIFGLALSGGTSYGDGGGDQVINGRMTRYGWFSALRGAALLGAAGGVVGLTVWRVAYRRRRNDQAGSPA